MVVLAGIGQVYEEASRLFRQQQYAEALLVLQQAGDSVPPEFVYARIRCLSKLHRIDEALACCRSLDSTYDDPRVAMVSPRLLDSESTSEEELLTAITRLCNYEEAVRLFWRGRYAEALAVLGEAGEQDHAELVYARARCLSRLGRVEEALACCELLDTTYHDPRGAVLAQKIDAGQTAPGRMSPAKDEPSSGHEPAAAHVLEEATRLFQDSRYAKALAILDEVGEQDHAEFVYARAQCLSKLGRVEEALACCELLDTTYHDPRGAVLARKIDARLTVPGGTHSAEGELSSGRRLAAAQVLEEALSAEWGSLEQAFEPRGDDLAEALERPADRDALVAALQQQVEALSGEIDEFRAREAALTRALESARDDRDRLNEMLEQREAAVLDGVQRTAEREAVVTALEQQVEALKAEVDDICAQEGAVVLALESARTERDRLKEMLEQREAAVLDGVQRAAEREAVIAALQQQVEALKAEVDDIRAQERAAALESARTERDRLKEALGKARSEVSIGEDVLSEPETAPTASEGGQSEPAPLLAESPSRSDLLRDLVTQKPDKEEIDELRLSQLKAMYAELGVGMSTRRVVRLFGKPASVEDMDDPLPDGQAQGSTPGLNGAVRSMFKRDEPLQTWVYDASPWGTVKMSVANGRVVSLEWLV